MQIYSFFMKNSVFRGVFNIKNIDDATSSIYDIQSRELFCKQIYDFYVLLSPLKTFCHRFI